MTEVMSRDASFWDRPDTTKPKHYHKIGDKIGTLGHPLAKCDSRINLLPESKTDSDEVKSLLCRRCFREPQDR